MTHKLTFRMVTPGDLPAVVGLLADDPLGRQREQSGPVLDPAYAEALDALAGQPGSRAVLAELDGEAVGYLELVCVPSLSRRGMLRAQIEAVRVAAAHRGRGIGRRLVDHAIDVARDAGCGLVQLTSDKSREQAHRFYRQLGFEATHHGFKRAL